MNLLATKITDTDRINFLNRQERNGYDLVQFEGDQARGWSLHCTRRKEAVYQMEAQEDVRDTIDQALIRKMILAMHYGDQIVVSASMEPMVRLLIDELQNTNLRAALVDDKIVIGNLKPEDEDNIDA